MFRTQNVPTRAFTLTELLVVIAIVAMLVSMLLPAVFSARAAARRRGFSSHVDEQRTVNDG